MAITQILAKKWCTKGEMEVIGNSFGEGYKKLPEARLKQKVSLTRKMRDKFRDLAKRQRLEVRGKSSPRGVKAATDNIMTSKKAQLFDEALKRYETGLKAKSTPVKKKTAKKTAKKKVAKKKAAPKKNRVVKKSTAKKAEAKKTAAKKTTTKKSASKKPAKKASSKKASAKNKNKKKPGASLKALVEKRAKERKAKQERKRQKKSQASNLDSLSSRKGSTFKKNRGVAISSHISARGRRQQAKRDRR